MPPPVVGMANLQRSPGEKAWQCQRRQPKAHLPFRPLKLRGLRLRIFDLITCLVVLLSGYCQLGVSNPLQYLGPGLNPSRSARFLPTINKVDDVRSLQQNCSLLLLEFSLEVEESHRLKSRSELWKLGSAYREDKYPICLAQTDSSKGFDSWQSDHGGQDTKNRQHIVDGASLWSASHPGPRFDPQVRLLVFKQATRERECLLSHPYKYDAPILYPGDFRSAEEALAFTNRVLGRHRHISKGQLLRNLEHGLRHNIDEWGPDGRNFSFSDFLRRPACPETCNASTLSSAEPNLPLAETCRRPSHSLPPTAYCLEISDSNISSNLFLSLLQSHVPAVFRGGAKLWPALNKWTMPYLKRRAGKRKVHVKVAEAGGDFEGAETINKWLHGHKSRRIGDEVWAMDWLNSSGLNSKSTLRDYGNPPLPDAVAEKIEFKDIIIARPAGVDISLSSFLELLETEERMSLYLEYLPFKGYLPDLERDAMEYSWANTHLRRLHRNVWIGNGRTIGKLHFDPYENLMTVLSGQKHFTLFSPLLGSELYEGYLREGQLGADLDKGRVWRESLMESVALTMSPIDLRISGIPRSEKSGDIPSTDQQTKTEHDSSNLNRVDYEGKFTLFEQARSRSVQCTVGEGDILFLPAFWWHEVESYPSSSSEKPPSVAVNDWFAPFFTKEFPCPECPMNFNLEEYGNATFLEEHNVVWKDATDF